MAKKKWNIPVTWEMCGIVQVEGDTLEEAMETFDETSDHIHLPNDAQYVDGSFDMTCRDFEFVETFNRNQVKRVIAGEVMRERIYALHKKTAACGAKMVIEEDTPIDSEHLDSIWYGGPLATLSYKGYDVHLDVHGEVRLTAFNANGDVMLH